MSGIPARRPTPLSSAAPEAGIRARRDARSDSYRRLAETFHEVLSEQRPDLVLDRIADTVADLVPYDALTIYAADEARRELTPVLVRSAWREQILGLQPVFGQGIAGWVAENRQPVLSNEAHLDPRIVIVPGTPVDPEALIAVPLIARGAVKGTLSIYRLGGAHFEDEEFELAMRFGDAAALALDNAQVRARLEHEAQTDSLTGLYNHRYFHERLRAELTRASRARDTVSLMTFDIDDFKRVNDVFGHGVGDQLLAGLAEITSSIVRASDVVCRLGGEEFGVIMPSCSASDAAGFANRLNQRLAETNFDPAGRVTVSAGIAEGPQHAMNPRELVACADAAMMTAKARGKNGVVLFDDGLTAETPGRPSPRREDVRSLTHLRLLQSLSIKLNRLTDVHEIAMAAANELRLLVDYHNCRVYLCEGDDLVPAAFRGDGCTDCQKGMSSLRCKVGEGITGRAAATGKSVVVGSGLDCEFAVHIPGTAELEESLAAVPLLCASRTTGVLVISQLGADAFGEDVVRLLEMLAGHVAVALEKARRYERQRDEAREAKALLAFSDSLLELDSFDEVAREAVRGVARVLDVPEVSLWVRTHTGGTRRLAHIGELRAHRTEELVSALRGVNGWLALRPAGPDGQLDDRRLRLLAELARLISLALRKTR